MVHIWNLVTLTIFIISTKIELVLFIGGKFYYNKRLSQNSYKKVYIPSDKIVKLSRIYTKAKIFPLTRTVIQVLQPEAS